MKPEEFARQKIDAMLTQAGWAVQDRQRLNLYASRGVAIREFSVITGAADYLLFIDGDAVGIIEAKKEGETLTGVEEQSFKYRTAVPDNLPAARIPLPFAYESTGIETQFTSDFDPVPRSRPLFYFHRPEMLA
jgi:type I restriction enzyme, R subunit